MKLASLILAAALLAAPLAQAQNPLALGKGLRTADPSGHVWKDGRMWLYTSHDEECQLDFHMKDWGLLTRRQGAAKGSRQGPIKAQRAARIDMRASGATRSGPWRLPFPAG